MSITGCGGQADVYRRACIHDLEEAVESCASIGYPIMLKASWGGGGKGIRKACLPHPPLGHFAIELAPEAACSVCPKPLRHLPPTYFLIT